MPLVPPDPVALAAFAVVLAGTAFVLFSRWPKAYTLGIVILAVFGIQMYSRLFQTYTLETRLFGDHVIPWLGFTTWGFVENLEWWTPLTYMYVHGDFLHIFGNLFILLTAGPVLEDRIGTKAFLWTYFVAGFAAALAHFLLSGIGPQPRFVSPISPAIGASGAIFGVLAAVATLYPRERLPMMTGFFVLWLPALLILAFYVVFNLAYLASDLMRDRPGGTAWYGHFAGLAVGLAAAAVIERGQRRSGAGTKTPGKVDVDALRPLATTPDLRDILAKIESMQGTTRDDAAFRDAWIDRFLTKARCLRCGGPLKREGARAVCEACGERYDLTARKL